MELWDYLQQSGADNSNAWNARESKCRTTDNVAEGNSTATVGIRVSVSSRLSEANLYHTTILYRVCFRYSDYYGCNRPSSGLLAWATAEVQGRGRSVLYGSSGNGC